MLIIIIAAITLGIGIAITWNATEYWDNGVEYAGIFVAALGGVVLFISLVILMVVHIDKPGEIEEMKTEYASLTYQYDNDIYENDNDVGKKELMKEIQEWNIKIARNKRLYKSPWVGWFIPDEYADFDFIELKPMK